mgnify:CR=1 FL=1
MQKTFFKAVYPFEKKSKKKKPEEEEEEERALNKC